MKLTRRVLDVWTIRSSVHSFAGTAHACALPALLASLARSAALIRSLAHLAPELKGLQVFVYGLNASI